MSEGRKRTAGTFGISGVAATAWKWLGDYLVADQLWRDRNAIMSGFGWLLDQWWFGPSLLLVAVVVYVGMGFWDDRFGRKSEEKREDPATPPQASQTLTQHGFVNAPVINIHTGVPPGPSSSSNAIQAEIAEKQKELADFKAVKESPKIRVSAVGGKSVTVVVENDGRPFTIGLYTRLNSSSFPIDHPGRPNEYIGRRFSSGGGEKTYEVAVLDDFGRVFVFGEYRHLIQAFESRWSRPASFEMELKFISKESEDHSPTIGKWMLRTGTDSKERCLKPIVERMLDR